MMKENEKLDLILSKVVNIESDVAELKSNFVKLKEEVQEIKVTFGKDIKDIKTEIKGIKQEIKDINLTLENEIKVSIQRVAEGHLDLSRNLHEAMKPNEEVELLAVKVRMLEIENRDIKRKLSWI